MASEEQKGKATRRFSFRRVVARGTSSVRLSHDYCSSPEAIRRRWKVICNPHAFMSVPEALFERIQSLDESSFFGLA